ncbi:hypothetical protein IFM89_034505 [Coptis chinensis]|uniref:Uncharacterized protein n=1 Tax=Coptis chinensis TaxID=261450 RepID=A0A835LSF7_9MAGN|nr:hypothetical protein IFM89_034505 [Coptis chinensis]
MCFETSQRRMRIAGPSSEQQTPCASIIESRRNLRYAGGSSGRRRKVRHFWERKSGACRERAGLYLMRHKRKRRQQLGQGGESYVFGGSSTIISDDVAVEAGLHRICKHIGVCLADWCDFHVFLFLGARLSVYAPIPGKLVERLFGMLRYLNRTYIYLPASTIASSFGKTISENKELEDYMPEDISLSLLRMILYNIGQGHAYTMDTISFAIHFWSKGKAKAMFLRHEGFLGTLGAFMSYEKHGLDNLMAHHFVERFPMGAPCVGGKIHGPPLRDLSDKASIIIDFDLDMLCSTVYRC